MKNSANPLEMRLTKRGFRCKIDKYDIANSPFANTLKGKGSYEKDEQKTDYIIAWRYVGRSNARRGVHEDGRCMRG